MNSSQRRKHRRYIIKLTDYFCTEVIKMLEDLQSGKTTFEKELDNAKEIKDILKKV